MKSTYTNSLLYLTPAPNKVLKLICETKNNFTTFNQLVTAFEVHRHDGILFLCNNDTELIVQQQLIFFCKYYKIALYGLEKGSRASIEKMMNKKNVTMVFVLATDVMYGCIKATLEL